MTNLLRHFIAAVWVTALSLYYPATGLTQTSNNNVVHGTVTNGSAIHAIQRGTDQRLDVQMEEGTANRVVTIQGGGNGNRIAVRQRGGGSNQVVVGNDLNADVTQLSGGQMGNNNSITIDQDGSDHTAWVTEQRGDDNEIGLKQSTHSNFAQFQQIGDDNKITATQDGSNNRADVSQTALSGKNNIALKQSGQGEEVELIQESGNNLILLQQAGEASSFRATQLNEGNRIVGANDRDFATQRGNRLDAEILQKGSAANTLHFEQSQTSGAKTVARITQADGATATFRQKGSGSKAILNQNGKNTITLDQQGDNLQVALTQDGTGNEIELVQRTSGSKFEASQAGQDNVLHWNEQGAGLANNIQTKISQSGNSNSIVMKASGR